MINKAENYCWFMTPYLIITDEMTHALCLAAKRGVDVRIITPGIPDKDVYKRQSGEIAHPGKKKVLRTFLLHHLELTRKEFRVSEVINHMPAFHVVAGIAICTPHCAANDDIHVLNLIFDTNTHDFCHSSRSVSYTHRDV